MAIHTIVGMRRIALLTLLAFALVAFACETRKPKPPSEPGETLYALKGTILSRDREANSLRIDHEAVPGFMAAMTMDYPVRGAEVDSLPADRALVVARLHVHDNRYWITDVKPAR